jgi:hypothetical protein
MEKHLPILGATTLSGYWPATVSASLRQAGGQCLPARVHLAKVVFGGCAADCEPAGWLLRNLLSRRQSQEGRDAGRAGQAAAERRMDWR